MKPTPWMLIAVVLVTPHPSSAQAQFEGRVRGTISAAGRNIEIEQVVKGSRMRLDMELPDGGGSVSQIMDMGAGRTVMLLHDQRTWADMSLMAEFIPGFANPGTSGPGIDLPPFERTERVETIAAYECRHYILLLEGGDDVDVCSAAGLGSFIPGAPAGLSGGGGQSIPSLPQSAELWMEEFRDGFFILSIEGGGALYRATSVEAGPVPDDLFVPPPDYSPLEIPSF